MNMDKEFDRPYFTFFRTFMEQINMLPDDDQLVMYRAIVNYALDHKDHVFTSPMQKIAWVGIKACLDNAWVKYLNGKNSKGIPKPTLKGNKNASIDKTKLNQSENEALDKLGLDKLGLDKDCLINNKKNNYGTRTPQQNIADIQRKHLADIAQSITQTDERPGEVSTNLPFN